MKNRKPRSKTRQMQITTQLRKGSKKQTSQDVKMFAKFKLQILFASSVTLAQQQKHHFKAYCHKNLQLKNCEHHATFYFQN